MVHHFEWVSLVLFFNLLIKFNGISSSLTTIKQFNRFIRLLLLYIQTIWFHCSKFAMCCTKKKKNIKKIEHYGKLRIYYWRLFFHNVLFFKFSLNLLWAAQFRMPFLSVLLLCLLFSLKRWKKYEISYLLWKLLCSFQC